MRRSAAVAAALALLVTGVASPATSEPGPGSRAERLPRRAGPRARSTAVALLRTPTAQPLAGPTASEQLSDLSGDLVPTQGEARPRSGTRRSPATTPPRRSRSTGPWPRAWSGRTRPPSGCARWTELAGRAARRRPCTRSWRPATLRGPAMAADPRRRSSTAPATRSSTPARWSMVGIEPQRGHQPGRADRRTRRGVRLGRRRGRPGDLPGRIAAAKPDAFVEVVTLRREAYDQIRDQIRDLAGTVFQESTPAARAHPRLRPGPAGHRRRRAPRSRWTRTRASTWSATRSASPGCRSSTTTCCAARPACRS